MISNNKLGPPTPIEIPIPKFMFLFKRNRG